MSSESGIIIAIGVLLFGLLLLLIFKKKNPNQVEVQESVRHINTDKTPPVVLKRKYTPRKKREISEPGEIVEERGGNK